MTATARSRLRVRAPELAGRGWLNTGGRDVTLADLRGRIVVLDFWTFCCVNCLHVLDELRPLEQRYDDSLVLIGVHSPKFEHEADPDALVAAVERYAVQHPVLDDPDLVTWNAYTARAWPTLVVIDPEGYVVASLSGEGHGPGLAVLIDELVEEHTARGTLRRGDAPYVPAAPASTALRFPGKAAALPDGSFLVSDTAHHQLVHLETDLVTERTRIGGEGTFNEPQGVLALPAEVAARVGYDVVVADSVHHQVKGVRLADGVGGGARRHRPAAARALRQRPRAAPGPVDAVGPRLVPRPGRDRHGRHAPAVGAAPGTGPCATTPSRCWPAPRPRASATAPRTTRGSPSPRAWPPPPTDSACGSPTPRPPRCARSPSPATASRSPPTSGRDCSTSATGTAPPGRR